MSRSMFPSSACSFGIFVLSACIHGIVAFESDDMPPVHMFAQVKDNAVLRASGTALRASSGAAPKANMDDSSVMSLPAIGMVRKQPAPSGHFLTNAELGNISSVECLEAKQRDPSVNCESYTQLSISDRTVFSGSLSIGNYPNWWDDACGSNGEYFCDPAGSLNSTERDEVQSLLKDQRYHTPVSCGQLDDDKLDNQHLQPFYLGIALAENFPTGELDPASLQWFGQTVAAKWNMNKLYTGAFRPYAMCPNLAVLVIIPDSHQAYLSSQSCEFICASRGGPEIVTRTLAALDRGGKAEAVKAGIQEVYRALGAIPTQSTVQKTPTPVLSITWDVAEGGLWWFLALRTMFVLSIVAILVSLLIAAFVCILAPGLLGRAGGIGTKGRRFL